MKIRFKKLVENAVIPAKAYATDAGFDLVCTSYEEIPDLNATRYHSGIAVEIPEGYVGLVFPRSSVYKTDMHLSNCVGVIDAGYRGEIMAVFSTNTVIAHIEPNDEGNGWEPHRLFVWKDSTYKEGDRFAQLIIMPIPEIEFEEVEELSDSDRGAGGYGSSGK